ncbi:MAG TPA: hypothetical protein VGF55_13065 [Gemmataceae bacterium]|jgi:hypothetical protein
MDQYLTIEEIRAKYPDEWVLISQPRTDQYHKVLGGTVVAHSPDRDEVDAKSFELLIPRHFAVRFTGKRQPGHILVL